MAGDEEPRQPIEMVVFGSVAPSERREGRRRICSRRLAALGVVIAAAALVVVHVVGNGGSRTPHRNHAAAAPLHDPSRAVTAAFAQHLPGAVVVTERTASGPTSSPTSVRRRVITAVTGNVKMKVTIVRTAVVPPLASRSGHVVAHRGYVFTFRFAGFYPPSARKLQALADDPRLVSAQA